MEKVKGYPNGFSITKMTEIVTLANAYYILVTELNSENTNRS